MTKGILGVIACPMLEDELIHSLSTDPEEKTVYVLDNPYNGSLRRKLEYYGVPFTTMGEFEFMNCKNRIDRSRFNVVIKMKDLGLHAEPKVLMEDLENELVMIQGRVDAVAMYYGMCGNYGWDLTEWGKEHVDFPIEVFRDYKGRVCDDCVGVSVGGLDGYLGLIKEFTGVLLATPAVATNWQDFLGASDMAKGMDVFPGDTREEKMRALFHMCGYENAVQIDNHLEPRDEFDRAMKEMCDSLDLKILQADPSYIDTGPMERIYRESKNNLDRVAARS